MRYLALAILVGLTSAGCACNQRTAPEPAPLPAETVKREPEPKPQEATATGVPLLGDIPVLGHLFKTRNEEK